MGQACPGDWRLQVGAFQVARLGLAGLQAGHRTGKTHGRMREQRPTADSGSSGPVGWCVVRRDLEMSSGAYDAKGPCV